jgi:hypothetical protein
MLPRIPLHRWLAVAFFVLVLYFYPNLTQISTISGPTSHQQISSEGVEDLTYVKGVLKKHKIGPEVSYASRRIRYIPDNEDRPPMTKVDQILFPEPFLDIKITKLSSLPAGRPLELHVKQSARPNQVDASSLMFGCSTTFGRFTSENTGPIDQWARWLTDGQGHSNGAGLILALFNATEPQVDQAAAMLAEVGINATVVLSDVTLDMAGRYVALVNMLYNHPTRESRKFFTLVDDDTFFPAMSELLHTLSKYDPEYPYYIGTFTERANWLVEHQAPYAYGGGGIFLTAPVARQIVQMPCLEKNEAGRYLLDADQGDRLLYNCLRQNTEIRVTYLPLLYQEDQFGDPSGFYESGRQPLSLHHYKSWHSFLPGKAHFVVDACGEDCLFQRWQFNDNFILSNGYSVAEYPKGIDFDTGLMEGTFDMGGEEEMATNLAYVFGSLRKSLSRTGRKRAWELLDSTREGAGWVKQVYVKRRGDRRWAVDGEEGPENDSIIVLEWIP